ncbi:vitamin B6 photo-protection and homoeostasis-domain-containing protein [Cokeromyces recurvatus]|uniref:vitamin B6 photo-protection and homoeostasis-domain-containing protein n=1 Tax=Cokeromyces recurvatus TaxID=90255 RepID=UPI00222007EB|nr:vitamin B6 photo-protection and homoeostasis-domain-containing protein [Cokeromyces recurvatus]KAI7898606.1 vitamin B6 photo-protection and homoeostasis-domain-containing protein [Cokeromyces recurvatus]
MIHSSRIIVRSHSNIYTHQPLRPSLTRLFCHNKRTSLLKNTKRLFHQELPKLVQEQRQEPILTEFVYGRKRIYTSLQTIGKTKSNSVSKGRVAAPIATSPMSWEWIQPIIEDNDKEKKKEWYQLVTNRNRFSVLHSIKQNLREMFLPVGYPESVHDCYKKFHLWLFFETYVGSAIGVLCSQAMLASLGLGAVEATGGAVAIQWVLKDGIGEIGKLFFIKRYASSFDSHPKTWKFVCELLSSVGSFLQLCTSVVSPKLFLPLAAAGNTFELIHESIWIASHMTFTKHFSPNGNIGDIVAKDDAQMSTAHLLGMLTGVGIISISHSPMFLFGIFAILSPLNIWTTCKMLHTAEFEILNQAKLTLLGRKFIDSGGISVIDYEQLKDHEAGFGEWIKPSYYGSSKDNIVKIRMGSSAEKAFASSGEVQEIVKVLKHENYLLNYHKNTMWILFHQDAESNDVIKSILHSLKFYEQLTRTEIVKEKDWERYMYTLEDSLNWTRENYKKFITELDKKNWQSDIVYWNDSGMRLDWKSYEDKDRSF